MKVGRVITVLIGTVTLLGSGAYVFIDLARWEWQRATLTAVLFLAAEMAAVAWILAARLARATERIDALENRRRGIQGHLRDARDEPPAVFEWLRPDLGRTQVFVPILMGAGLVLSGLAWLVERVGRVTAGATVDGSVAAQLARLGPPAGGFLDDNHDPLRTLRTPAGAPR